MNYLRSNPATPDGTHFNDFINLGAWDTCLRRMAMDGEWGAWIALWGLINMLQLLVPMAIVSSLEETGLKVIYPANCQNEAQATGDMALLGHEALSWPGTNCFSESPTSHCRGIKANVWRRTNHRRNLSKMWTKIRVLLIRYFRERWCCIST